MKEFSIFEHQEKQFNDFWRKFYPQVASGESYADIDTGQKRAFTIVARLPQELASALSGTSGEIATDFPDLYVYLPETIHTTILYLSPYVASRDISDVELSEIKDIIKSVADHTAPIKMKVKGLGTFPTTIFSQIYVEDMDQLYRLRQLIAKKLKNKGFYSQEALEYEKKLNWKLAFANIIRYQSKVPGEIINAILPYRDTYFGNMQLEEIEIVTTDKFLSMGGTDVHEKFTLQNMDG